MSADAAIMFGFYRISVFVLFYNHQKLTNNNQLFTMKRLWAKTLPQITTVGQRSRIGRNLVKRPSTEL